MAGCGVETAGFIVGGSQDNNPTMTAETLEWDGSAWSEGGDYPGVTKYFTAFGSQTNAITAGGAGPGDTINGVCASYDGTAWTAVASLTTARLGSAGNGTGTSGFAAAGESPGGAVVTTEEWAVPQNVEVITD